MDLKTFKFPELNGIDLAFSTLKTDKTLLEEAKERGFYNGRGEYNTLFSKLFFSGGQITFKENLDPDFKTKAWTYTRAFMRSFEPKHEEKEAICAMLLSELVEPTAKDV